MAAGSGNEPNLTPFIDLFSVLVCFLLMTAAWLQLDSLSTSIDKSTSHDVPDSAPPKEKKTQFSVIMRTGDITLKEDNKITNVPNVDASIDRDKIKYYLGEWKKRFPDRRDIILMTEKDVLYGDMISMYDLMIDSDWPDVGINPQ